MELEVKNGKRGFDKAIIIILIIALVGYLVVTGICLSAAISDYQTAQNPGDGITLGPLGFVLVTIVVGSIGYGIVTILSIVNLILSIVNKESPKLAFNIVASTLGIIIPYLTEVLMLWIIPNFFG